MSSKNELSFDFKKFLTFVWTYHWLTSKTSIIVNFLGTYSFVGISPFNFSERLHWNCVLSVWISLICKGPHKERRRRKEDCIYSRVEKIAAYQAILFMRNVHTWLKMYFSTPPTSWSCNVLMKNIPNCIFPFIFVTWFTLNLD